MCPRRRQGGASAILLEIGSNFSVQGSQIATFAPRERRLTGGTQCRPLVFQGGEDRDFGRAEHAFLFCNRLRRYIIDCAHNQIGRIYFYGFNSRLVQFRFFWIVYNEAAIKVRREL